MEYILKAEDILLQSNVITCPKKHIIYHCISKLDIFQFIPNFVKVVNILINNANLDDNNEDKHCIIEFENPYNNSFCLIGKYKVAITNYIDTHEYDDFFDISNDKDTKAFRLQIYGYNHNKESYAYGENLISEYVITYKIS